MKPYRLCWRVCATGHFYWPSFFCVVHLIPQANRTYVPAKKA